MEEAWRAGSFVFADCVTGRIVAGMGPLVDVVGPGLGRFLPGIALAGEGDAAGAEDAVDLGPKLVDQGSQGRELGGGAALAERQDGVPEAVRELEAAIDDVDIEAIDAARLERLVDRPELAGVLYTRARDEDPTPIRAPSALNAAVRAAAAATI